MPSQHNKKTQYYHDSDQCRNRSGEDLYNGFNLTVVTRFWKIIPSKLTIPTFASLHQRNEPCTAKYKITSIKLDTLGNVLLKPTISSHCFVRQGHSYHFFDIVGKKVLFFHDPDKCCSFGKKKNMPGDIWISISKQNTPGTQLRSFRIS